MEQRKQMSRGEIIGRSIQGACIATLLFLLLVFCMNAQRIDLGAGSAKCADVPAGQICPQP